MDFVQFATRLNSLILVVAEELALEPQELHSRIRPELENLLSNCTSVGSQGKYPNLLRVCLLTALDGAYVVKSASYGTVTLYFLRLLAHLARRCIPAATTACELPELHVLSVYLARHFTVRELTVLVVLTEDRCIDLPSHLVDGTPIQQLCLSEPAKVIPELPHRAVYEPSTKESKKRAYQVLNQHFKNLVGRRNIFGATVASIRGEWHIVIGVCGKGLIPVGDTLLPKHLEDVPVSVAEFRRIPLSNHQRWGSAAPQPQIGGALAPSANRPRADRS